MQEMGPALPIATIHPEPVDLDWSKEDWVAKKKERREKQKEEEIMKQKLSAEECRAKPITTYYPPSPQYIPSYEEEPLIWKEN